MQQPAADYGAVTVGNNGRSLQAAFVDVSPDLAVQWLNLEHPENRKSATTTVDDYRTMMGNNLWSCMTGEPIKFDVIGRLIDGGHRLRAIIALGESVPMFVVWGCPVETFHLLDQGRARGRLWWETQRGRAVNQLLVKFYGGSFAAHRATTIALLESMKVHRSAIEFACEVMPMNARGIATATTRAILARASYTVDPQVLVDFSDAICAKRLADTDRRKFMVAKLVAYLTAGASTEQNRSERYYKTERYLKAFIDDELLTKVYRSSVELFPLPGEELS